MDQPKDIRKGEELNWKNLETYLKDSMPELSGDLEVAQFHGGHANLTYQLKFGDRELVLRRPPFGKIAPGAHDMKREFKVLSKLYQHFPQAPQAFLVCDEHEVIGADFILMERRNGVVVRKKMLDCFAGFDNAHERLTIALMKTEAALHTVDVEAAGLSDLGKPDGFINRQLAGWQKRWELSKTEDNEHMDQSFELLKSDIPEPQAIAIVHNDIKFDNCQFQPDNPDQVSSVFDWDMATIGDPLFDFATTLGFWPDKHAAGMKTLPVLLEGPFPDKAFLINKYSEFTGYNMDRISWYHSLAYCKVAVIAQQLYKRYVDGASTDKRMMAFGEAAKAMAYLARTVIDK